MCGALPWVVGGGDFSFLGFPHSPRATDGLPLGDMLHHWGHPKQLLFGACCDLWIIRRSTQVKLCVVQCLGVVLK